jgi:hypothetical protein
VFNKQAMSDIIYDPRLMISPPFSKCPKCQQNTFGILSIRNNHYEKRCRTCMFPNPHENESSFIIPLPKISKKIVYMDQMVMSNMMKVLNPKAKSYNKIDNIWLQLFERIEKLCKMQLIICPSSSIHQIESSLSPYYDAIKSMYQLLSGGIKFKNPFKLKMDQIIMSLQLFLDNKPFTLDILDHDLAFNENINIWQDHIFLTVESNISVEEIEKARKHRDEISIGFNKIFVNWQLSKKTFQEFFEIEENASAESALSDYKEFMKKQASINDEEKIKNIFNFDLPSNIILLDTIHSKIKKIIPDPISALQTTIEFLNSDNFKSIPTHRISSYMFAGIARKATQGQKRSPSKGMLNDIEIISDYLPFCDAMFLDNECVALLKEKPTGDYIRNIKTKLFSKNTINDFFDYLDKIEKDTTTDHINKISTGMIGVNHILLYTKLRTYNHKQIF